MCIVKKTNKSLIKLLHMCMAFVTQDATQSKKCRRRISVMLNTPLKASLIGLHTQNLDAIRGDYMRLVKLNIILYIKSCDEGDVIKLLRVHFVAEKVVVVGVELDANS